MRAAQLSATEPVLAPGGRVSLQRARIAALALASGLLAVAEWRDFTVAGGLMSYGTSRADLVPRAASFVDRILKGAKPADLPVERPMRFDFVFKATPSADTRSRPRDYLRADAREVHAHRDTVRPRAATGAAVGGKPAGGLADAPARGQIRWASESLPVLAGVSGIGCNHPPHQPTVP